MKFNAAHRRRGQALLEFAFITVVLLIVIGGTLTLGQFLFWCNALQQAVDVGAQEIARMPFAPSMPLGLGELNASVEDTASQQPEFLNQIYDERHLIIPDAVWTTSYGTLQEYADAELPLLNRLLVPVMIRDDAQLATRYPGAVVNNTVTSQQTVLVPIVEYDNTGSETIVRWVAPVEEIRIDHDANPNTANVGPFSVVPPLDADASFPAGMVALRINYPAQSATLINRVGETGETLVVASDADVDGGGNPSSNYQLVVADGESFGPQSGRYGLGRQIVHTQPAAAATLLGVRPYRKLISVEAIYRREVFN